MLLWKKEFIDHISNLSVNELLELRKDILYKTGDLELIELINIQIGKNFRR